VPSIFSHAIFATVIGKACVSKQPPFHFWVLTAVCAMLPDADGIAFVLRIPYGSMLGHRGITHSIFFAAVVGLVAGMITFVTTRGQFSRTGLVIYFALVTLSHPLLDALTNGGRGVALFAPLDGARYFFPWRPIEVSPIGLEFFSERGLEVIASEIVWVWLPALLIWSAVWIYRKSRKGNKKGS
jgi:inner membrane protein